MKNQILEMSRQNLMVPLSPWFDKTLDKLIKNGDFLNEKELKKLATRTIDRLIQYREQTNTSTAMVGISGGVDSALTATLLKQAGWNVIGVVMPIHQDLDETKRGLEVCNTLGIKCIEKNLSIAFDQFKRELEDVDPALFYATTKESKIRQGNIRARLRMITLYTLAAANHGLVASTDNFSELAAGFWTLHGDVGDLSPIQSMLKSWEVPMLAKMLDVPETIWRANPTDGLGVDSGDEAQFGFSYLELDLMLLEILYAVYDGLNYDLLRSKNEWNVDGIRGLIGVHHDDHAANVYKMLTERMGNTWYKRCNPVNILHEFFPHRYQMLEEVDKDLFQPGVVKE